MVRIRTSKEARLTEAKEAYNRMYQFKTDSGFQSFCQNLSAWDVQWRSKVARDNKPWDHATNYNVPITFHKVEDVHAVIMSFLNNPNFFSVAAAGGAADQDTMRERARLRTELLRWSLQNESCAQAFLDRFVHDGLLYGCAFGYLPWLILQRNMRSEELLPDELRKAKKIPDKEVLIAAMGPNLLKKRALGDGVFEVTFIDDDGEEKHGRAYVDRDNPNRPKGEPTLILERDVTYFNAPDPRNVAPWDIMVPTDARDLQTATRFWVRDFLSVGDLRRLSRLAIFNAVSAADITELEADIEKSGGYGGRGDQDMVDETRDQDFAPQKIQSRKDKLEIYYEYAMEPDADGSMNSIVRAFTNIRRPMLLMRQNVEYLYPHGRRPYFDWHMLPVDDRYYGMGIPEILEPTQNEANAYYQARSDVLEIITKPGGIYDPMSGLAPREIKYSPGMFIAVRDVDRAYRPFVFPTNPMPLFNEQAGVEAHAERVVGSTDMGLGRGSSRPNAPRTLGGTAILVRQQQVRMDVLLRRLMYGRSVVGGGVSEFLRQYMDLYVALMPPEKEFRALGTGDVHKVQRADLQGRFDFTIDFGEEINNPQIRLQNAMLRYQNAVSNPLIMQNPQALWHLTIDFLEASGMRNASRILPAPTMGANRPPMPQEEEFAILSKGIWLEPLPTDDHGAHLTAIAQLVQDPMRLAQMFGAAEIAVLGKHAEGHMAMLAQVSAGREMDGRLLAEGSQAPEPQDAQAQPAAPMMGSIANAVEGGAQGAMP